MYRYTPHMTPSEPEPHLDSMENLPDNVFRGQQHTLCITNVNVQMPGSHDESFGSITFDLTQEQAQTVVNLLEAMDVKVVIVIDPVPMEE